MIEFEPLDLHPFPNLYYRDLAMREYLEAQKRDRFDYDFSDLVPKLHEFVPKLQLTSNPMVTISPALIGKVVDPCVLHTDYGKTSLAHVQNGGQYEFNKITAFMRRRSNLTRIPTEPEGSYHDNK